MTIDWFRVDVDIAENPKTGRLADALGVEIPHAVGYLIALFAKVRRYRAHGGVLGDIPDSTLEQWALWAGKRGRFAAAFRETFCDDGILRGWKERQEPLIRRLERDRQRAQERRDRERTEAGRSGDESADESMDESADESGDRPGHTVTGTDTTLRSTTPRVPDAAEMALRDRLPGDGHADLDALLERLAPSPRRAWVAEMRMMLDGGRKAAVSPAVLAAALHDFAANDGALTLALFRRYVDKAAEPPREASDAPTVSASSRSNGIAHTSSAERLADRSVANTRAALASLRAGQPVGGI